MSRTSTGYTPGAGALGAIDRIGSVDYPLLKPMIGADGVANPIDAGAGAVDVGTQRVTLASDDPAVALLGAAGDSAPSLATNAEGIIGWLRYLAENTALTSARARLSPTITVTATTYSANTCVGGKLTLTPVNASAGAAGMIERVVLRSASTTLITASFRAFIFDSNPSSSTFTDNGTFDVVAADASKCIGFADLTSWAQAGTSSNVSICDSGPLALPYMPTSSQTLYMALMTLGAPVFSGTTNLSAVVQVAKGG